jgi:hypothetical protein
MNSQLELFVAPVAAFGALVCLLLSTVRAVIALTPAKGEDSAQ